MGAVCREMTRDIFSQWLAGPIFVGEIDAFDTLEPVCRRRSSDLRNVKNWNYLRIIVIFESILVLKLLLRLRDLPRCHCDASLSLFSTKIRFLLQWLHMLASNTKTNCSRGISSRNNWQIRLLHDKMLSWYSIDMLYKVWFLSEVVKVWSSSMSFALLTQP